MMPQSILRQTLHSMLLQHNRKGEILLFPAWPAGWEVSFKLHAPGGVTVQARCINGTVDGLRVTPASREGDVRLLGCKTDDMAAAAAGSVTTFHSANRVEIVCAASDSAALVAALRSTEAHRLAGKEVVLRLQGKYRLTAPLNFGLSRPLSARPARLSKLTVLGPCVLDGGVDVVGWVRDSSRPWLFSAAVPEALRTGNETITQMFDGERRVPPARTPVLHYDRIGAVSSTGQATSIVVSNISIPHSFKDLAAVRLFLYHAWDVSFHQLSEIRQGAGGLELLVANRINTLWGVGAGAPGYRYFLEGAEEFLHPGSGTFVHSAGRLLYAPADGVAPTKVVVPRLTELVRTDGTSDVTLDSLTLQHSAVDFSNCFQPSSFCEMQSAADQMVAAVHWTNSERIELLNTTIRRTGGYGVWSVPARLTHTVAKNTRFRWRCLAHVAAQNSRDMALAPAGLTKALETWSQVECTCTI